MSAPIPGSGPDEPQPSRGAPGPETGRPAGGVRPAGLDYQALLDALGASGMLDCDPEDQDAELAERLAAEEDGRLEPCDPARMAALAVEHMEPGPSQAGWLGVAAAGTARLDENEAAGVAIAFRKLASWAQACELAAVARITACAAAADPKIGVEADGRPARVCRDALGQVALALMLTHHSAEAWADLAVTLAWRLPATGAALAAGTVDMYRARLIAEAISVLSEQAARKVEGQVLPGAGRRTAADLRSRLRRAVIAADPEGADERRRAAERTADVRLYADDDQTATITANKLPQIEGAAGYARITAMARARMAAGMGGGLGFNRAQVLLGLMLGTLPFIPPAEGAPPDQPPPDAPGSSDPAGPGSSDPAGPGSAGTGGGARGHGPADNGQREDLPAPRDEDAPADDGLGDDAVGADQDRAWDPAEEDDDPHGTGPVAAWPALGVIPPALARRPARPADGRPVPGLLDATVPWTTLAGLSEGPGTLGRIGPITAAQARQLAHTAETDPAAQWRVIVTNDAGQAIVVARIRRPRRRRPDRGSLAPARDGPGAARAGPAACRDGPSPGTGLVGRITVTISQDCFAGSRAPVAGGQDAVTSQHPASGPGPPGGIAAAALRTAARALDRARAQAEADAAAGGCAHHAQSPGYRPPPRLREHVIARDVTCRSPVCRQPAWRADLDHTRAWAPGDNGGRTCSCNLGGGCRRDHQLKQHPRWELDQIRPGVFRWTTPARPGLTTDVSAGG